MKEDQGRIEFTFISSYSEKNIDNAWMNLYENFKNVPCPRSTMMLPRYSTCCVLDCSSIFKLPGSTDLNRCCTPPKI